MIINKIIKYILTNIIRQELLFWTSIKIFLFTTNCYSPIVSSLSKNFLASNDQNKKRMTQEYENLQDMLDFKQVHYPGTFPSWNLSRHARSADSHAGIVTAASNGKNINNKMVNHIFVNFTYTKLLEIQGNNSIYWWNSFLYAKLFFFYIWKVKLG